ncbi:MAG: CoA-binding protein [Bacteroidota bacterium]
MNKPTVIIGASPDPGRYSYLATASLKKKGHTVFPVGLRAGNIEGENIITDKPALSDIHTVTLYVGQKNQAAWTDYILSLHPKRIIFNPGAENPDLFASAAEQGIECQEACTLVMLSVGTY